MLGVCGDLLGILLEQVVLLSCKTTRLYLRRQNEFCHVDEFFR